MKLFFKLLIFSLLTSCSASATKHSNDVADISYNVSYINTPINQLEVNFNYKSDANGNILLKFENNSWGDTNIYNCIGDFQVMPKPINVEFDRDNSYVKITTTPNQESTITYTIKQDFKEALKNHHRYRPIITKDYFHILGMRLFMFPVELFKDTNSKALFNISWDSLPNKGLFHSSFGKERDQLIEVTQEELYASFFVGGDFRRYQFYYQNKPVYFVTRGDWKSISDKEVLKILEETVQSQYQFWNDAIKTQFSVSLIPTTEEKGYSIGGSGLTDSFISFASNNPTTTNQRLTWLYNHELMHKWLGRTILNENEVEQYWFSEGFTDYYAYKLMLKHNNLTLKEFVDIINNEVLMPHYQDKVATIPNAELTFQKYWSNYATYSKLPYRRGLLYALILDTQIKQQTNFTKSLDDLMLSLYDKALKDSNFRLNSTTFKKELSTYLSNGALKDFEKYITNGELIDFKGQLLEGLSVTQQQEVPMLSVNQKKAQQLLKQLKQ